MRFRPLSRGRKGVRFWTKSNPESDKEKKAREERPGTNQLLARVARDKLLWSLPKIYQLVTETKGTITLPPVLHPSGSHPGPGSPTRPKRRILQPSRESRQNPAKNHLPFQGKISDSSLSQTFALPESSERLASDNGHHVSCPAATGGPGAYPAVRAVVLPEARLHAGLQKKSTKNTKNLRL